MAKPDLSGVRSRSSDILGFLAPPVVLLGGFAAVLWFGSPEGQASIASNTTGNNASGSNSIVDANPHIAQIDSAAAQLATTQEVVSLSVAGVDPEFYYQARAEGTCGVIGVDADTVADVLYRELAVGELSPASDNILVFEADGSGTVEAHPYAQYRIGAVDREYVDTSDTVCIDKTLIVGSTR